MDADERIDKKKLLYFLKKMGNLANPSIPINESSSKVTVKATKMLNFSSKLQSYPPNIDFSITKDHITNRPLQNQPQLYKSLQDRKGITFRKSIQQKTNQRQKPEQTRLPRNKMASTIQDTKKGYLQKLYQIPFNSKRIKQKGNGNLISLAKIGGGGMNEDVKTTFSQNFNTFFQLNQFLSKLSNQSSEQNAYDGTQESKYTNIGNLLKNSKRCSIIPALKPSNFKKKQLSKPQSSIDQFEQYLQMKKAKLTLQKSFVVQSKKQQIITNAITKYKLKNNKNRYESKDNQIDYNDGESLEELEKKTDDKEVGERRQQCLDGSKKKEQLSPRQIKINRAKKHRNIPFFYNNHNEQGVYQQKIRSYRQLLFIINISHRIYNPLQILDGTALKLEKNITISRPTYYIGPGNNSYLIRSLMKRRIWWQEVSNYHDANFVWTQLKIVGIYKDQQSCSYNYKSQEEIRQEIQLEIVKQAQKREISKSKKTIKKQQNQSKDGSSIGKLLRAQKCNYSTYQSKKSINYTAEDPNIPKGLMFKAPFSVKKQQKILTKNDAMIYKQMLKKMGKNNNENFENRLKYLPKDYLINKQNSLNITVHNHFQCNHSLGNKKALFYYLQLYYKIMNKPSNKAFPITFHIRYGQSDLQFKKFIQHHKRIQKESNNLKNIWILKPGENSNRGSGITVIKDISSVRRLIRGKQKHRNGQTKTFILQKYIQRPLLYKGRKFDIRHYMIISGIHGKIRAFWYGQGYIRTSSYLFNLQQVNDPMIHLTNDAIQKQSDDYGCHQQGNKISYNQLQKYFTKQFPQKKFDFHSIFNKMKQLARDAVHATYLSLDPNKKLHNFQVFGLDFMIDQDMDVMLIEVNTNPCLELSSGLLSRIIPMMLEQTFRVCLDPLYPPSLHYTNNTRHLAPDCSLDKLQMELIFDSGRDGQALSVAYKNHQEEYRAVQRILQGSEKEEDEVFQNQGEEISIDGLIS